MITSEENFRAFCQKEFPGTGNVCWDYPTKDRANKGYFHVQAGTTFGQSMNYEYNDMGRYPAILLNIGIEDYLKGNLKSYLFKKLCDNNKLRHGKKSDGENVIFVYKKSDFQNETDLFDAFKDIRNIVEKHILQWEKECLPEFKNYLEEEYELPTGKLFLDGETGNPVTLVEEKKISEIFEVDLSIPDYQRIYCWENKNIKDLWNDIIDAYSKDIKDYHIGTVILHKNDNRYDVVDGQQRLVTLTLFLRGLNYAGRMPLLKAHFESNDAIKYVANAKSLIRRLILDSNRKIENKKELQDYISNKLKLSVLVLCGSENLELAYNFFSNINSKGVPLSDYDLLKAHHLRYIPTEEQREHMAQNWNKLVSDNEDGDQTFLKRVLGDHLCRLRKWMRKDVFNEKKYRRVRDEYVASPTMLGIPPFGESFRFCEKIQGGNHFFEFSNYYVERYKEFVITDQTRVLRKYLYGKHWRYGQVVETLLFAYYIKFDNRYLSEALYCIVGIIAQHRYSNSSGQMKEIYKYAQNSEIVLMIDQASSPTFFLAESLSHISLSGREMYDGIQIDFYKQCKKIFNELNDFTDKIILNEKEYEYNRE